MLVLGDLALLRIPTTWVRAKGCLSAGNYLCCGDLLGWKGEIETFSEDRCLGLCERFGGKVHYPLV